MISAMTACGVCHEPDIDALSDVFNALSEGAINLSLIFSISFSVFFHDGPICSRDSGLNISSLTFRCSGASG